MYNDIWYQVVLFFVFFGLGIICALVFDAFRVWERFSKSNIFMVAVKDIIFWLIITILMFAICLKFNNGEIRFFMFVGILTGALIYFNTVSKFVLNTMYFIINLLKIITAFIIKILLFPLKFLVKLINKPVFIALSFSKKRLLKFTSKIRFSFKKFKKFKK